MKIFNKIPGILLAPFLILLLIVIYLLYCVYDFVKQWLCKYYWEYVYFDTKEVYSSGGMHTSVLLHYCGTNIFGYTAEGISGLYDKDGKMITFNNVSEAIAYLENFDFAGYTKTAFITTSK